MADYHSETHRAVGVGPDRPGETCKLCTLLDCIGLEPPALRESLVDAMLALFTELTIDDALRSKAERRICGHARWSRGCDSCRDWAVANGVAFAREMAATSETPE